MSLVMTDNGRLILLRQYPFVRFVFTRFQYIDGIEIAKTVLLQPSSKPNCALEFQIYHLEKS